LLLVEDDALLANGLLVALRRAHYTVEHVRDGASAVAALRDNAFDLAVLDLGLPDDAAHVNPNGGAIALGHPLGASGARLVTTAVNQLHRIKGRYALCTMCIGVGQGIAIIVERV